MQVPPHFEFLSSWLRGQHQSVERVEAEQSSATHLVSTAEYELGRLRRELSGLALEPGSGIAALSDVDILATKVEAVQREPKIVQSDEAKPHFESRVAAARGTQTNVRDDSKRARAKKVLPAQIRDLSSDAA